MLLLFSPFATVWAIDAPSAPSAPTTPSAPTAPSAPETPSAPSELTSSEPDDSGALTDSQPDTQPQTTPSETETTPTTTSTTNTQPTNQVSDGNAGDTAIKTGDANSSGAITTFANTNISATNPDNSGTEGTQVTNSGNGSGSTNLGTVDSTTNNTTTQNNNANVENDLELSTTTGDNSASKNVGDSYIQTGDANTTGTLLTYANTNINGVAVSEFNVVDNQNGDLVLDFAQNCILGCDNLNPVSVKNTDNGAESDNFAVVDQTTNNTTVQNNNADVGNNLTLSSDSGNNTTSYNTGGDSVIKTGDANTSASALSFLNNNIAGQVILGVVNIFGNLVGDIILPELTSDCASCSGAVTASNTGNGTDSTNTAVVNQTTNDATFQANTADIQNNLLLESSTGDNSASKNTGGDSVIKTGAADTASQTINIANTNVEGGNIWLVLVNQMGQWVGKILGAPVGSNFASAPDTQDSTSPDGTITVTNSGNGAGSDNASQVNQTTNNTTTQENNAKLVNNLNLSANSGGNNADANTGGTSFIQTGDAKVIANLVNFVNNNVASGKKLVVTVVNVFGSWVGDFVTPGTHKDKAQGGSTSNQDTTQDTTSQTIQSDSTVQDGSQDENVNQSVVSPKPTSAITTLVSQLSVKQSIDQGNKTAVAGASSNHDNGSGGTPKVQNDRKVISLNLAWLLLLLPFGGTLAAVRFRKFLTL